MNNSCQTTEKPKTIKELVRTWIFWKPILSFVIGGILGFMYYYFVGCTSGTCAITSSPYGSIIMGGLLGVFITSSPCLSCNR